MQNIKTLKPVRETPSDYDEIESAIKKLFREQIYYPLLIAIGLKKTTVKNSEEDLHDAILSGRIWYSKGCFRGKFDSTLSRELRNLGAEWERKQGAWKLPHSKIPRSIKTSISLSESKFKEKLAKLDKLISGIAPEEVAEKLRLENIFDTTLFKVDKEIRKSLDGITIQPPLSPSARKRISEEYTRNMQLYVKDFTEKETIELRKRIQASVYAGGRYESFVDEIQKSWGVSQSKAKFLARQETSLVMTKIKQTRYQEAGVDEYKWTCVKGSPGHEVRPLHKIHDGKIYSWNNPPVVDKDGNRKNPGQDYNCRCVAIPVVRF